MKFLSILIESRRRVVYHTIMGASILPRTLKHTGGETALLKAAAALGFACLKVVITHMSMYTKKVNIEYNIYNCGRDT